MTSAKASCANSAALRSISSSHGSWGHGAAARRRALHSPQTKPQPTPALSPPKQLGYHTGDAGDCYPVCTLWEPRFGCRRAFTSRWSPASPAAKELELRCGQSWDSHKLLGSVVEISKTEIWEESERGLKRREALGGKRSLEINKVTQRRLSRAEMFCSSSGSAVSFISPVFNPLSVSVHSWLHFWEETDCLKSQCFTLEKQKYNILTFLLLFLEGWVSLLSSAQVPEHFWPSQFFLSFSHSLSSARAHLPVFC